MPTTSILLKSMEAIKAVIQALSLTGIDSTNNILIRKVPRDIEKDMPPNVPAVDLTPAITPLPAILIAPIGAEQSDPLAGTLYRDQINYPIQILFYDQDNNDQELNADRYYLWRESVRRKLNNSRLSGVSEVVRVRIEPAEIVNPALWLKGRFAGGLKAIVTSRESRT